MPPSAPARVTSSPSRIHVAPKAITISQCHGLHGNRSSLAGIYVSTHSVVGIAGQRKSRCRLIANVRILTCAKILRAQSSCLIFKLPSPSNPSLWNVFGEDGSLRRFIANAFPPENRLGNRGRSLTARRRKAWFGTARSLADHFMIYG